MVKINWIKKELKNKEYKSDHGRQKLLKHLLPICLNADPVNGEKISESMVSEMHIAPLKHNLENYEDF